MRSAFGEGAAVTVGRDGSPTSEIAELYRRHRLNLVRLATLLTDDRSLAEELVHDAFAILQERWSRLADPAAAIGYLRTTVINSVRTVQRRQVMARRHLRVGEPEALPDADFALLIAEEHQQVVVAMRTLPPRQREVLVLRYWSEMSEVEIAHALGVSRGTVKSTASRALDAIEKLLKDTR
jgi:RNA polymerase sigma-70 factor (sigma-E family)